MKILFISSSRIGDAVLSTGILSHMLQTYPNARVTVACGPLVTSLFEGVPKLDRVIALKKRPYHGHWIDLWGQVIKTHWDIVIDLRNSAVSRMIFAKKRYIFTGTKGAKLHKVLQNAAVVNQKDKPPAPHLWFSQDQLDKADQLMDEKNTDEMIIGIGPAANWLAKTWPAENFLEICQWLTQEGGFYEGAKFAVFGAPGEEAICDELIQALPRDRVINLVSKGSPGDAGAMLARCDFYIGNDSGLMHMAAAAGVQTFGVFGPSYPEIYAPWGAHCGYARTPETFDALIDYEGYSPKTAPCLMASLSTEMVKKALKAFLS